MSTRDHQAGRPPVHIAQVLPLVMEQIAARQAARVAAEVPDWAVGASASLTSAADLTGAAEVQIEQWADAGLVRVERLQGARRYSLDDIMRQAAGATS